MIYFTKYDGGYRMFQTIVLYNTKAIYIWFEVFFFAEDQFKRFIEFKCENFRSRAITKLNFDSVDYYPCIPRFTKDQEKEIEVSAKNLKEEFRAWYLKVGDLSNKSEFYNGMEQIIFRCNNKPTFQYFIHYNRRIKRIISCNEEKISEMRIKDKRPKCSKSNRVIRIKSILKSIWNTELEIDIAYKMLIES